MRDNAWDIDTPFHIAVDVADDEIDRLNHVNNACYVRYLERSAWAHTEALGLNWSIYETLDAAFVVRRHELDYLAPALRGQRLLVATWIAENDDRISMWRGFQIRRASDGLTLLRGQSRFVCIRLSSGKPRRMPPEFVEVYRPVVS